MFNCNGFEEFCQLGGEPMAGKDLIRTGEYMHPGVDIINAIRNTGPFKKIRPKEGHVEGRNGDIDKINLFSLNELQCTPAQLEISTQANVSNQARFCYLKS